MITIQIDYNWSYASWDEDPKEFIALQEACSYKVHGYWFSPAFKRGQWDGKKCLFKKTRSQQAGRFPTGILQHVYWELKKTAGQEVNVEDLRVYPESNSSFSYQDLTFQLRDYQEDAVKRLLSRKCGVLKLPTAAGKTKTMVAVIRTLDLPTLWITHEGALARQSKKQIEEGTGREVGFYAGGKNKHIKNWTVGLVQSLHKHRKELTEWFSTLKVIVLDEAHRGGARTWYDLVMSIPAPYRYGCSATPFERNDQSAMELQGATGPVIYEKKPEEVKEFLSRPHVEMIQVPNIPFIASAWPDIFRKGIVENYERNKAIVDRAMLSVKEKSQCMVFVSAVAHGHLLHDMLREEIGVDGLCDFIYGKTPQNVRDECYDKLRSGRMRVLVASDKVAGEGQDIPSVKRIVVGGGLKAAILVKQRIGRGMRPDGEGEDGWGGEVFIHDFVDNQDPKLLRHSDMRRSHYKSINATFEGENGK